MSRKQVLVTGGAGFIGSNVNKMLNEVGYTTVVFDNLSKGSPKAVIRGTFIQGDLLDSAALEALFSKNQFDAVIHFAAFTDVGESVTNPSIYYRNNLSGSLNLLEAMRRHQVDTLIFSSSAAVYGTPNSSKILENHPCNPINPYGESKLMVEKILHSYHQAYGLKYCSLRYFNAAGGDPAGELKNYKTKENNLIPIALRSLKNESVLTIFGTDYPTKDGTCIRDYIHVYDLGSAHISAMQHLWEGQESSIYNLGNGNGFSVKEVLAAVEKVTKKKLKVQIGARRPGDPPILVADANKAIRELEWKPVYPDLEAMIFHAWKALA